MTRLLLVLACVAFLGLCLVGMRRGWTNRARRQATLATLPVVPAQVGPALLDPLRGVYVGTTTATSWQDRVVAGGLGARAAATATLTADGLLIERQGADALFVPAAAITSAGVGAGLAGKVMGAGGLLIVRWVHEGQHLDTGLRSDDKSIYPAWVAVIDTLTAQTPTASTSTEQETA